jgi:hypothetical protein
MRRRRALVGLVPVAVGWALLALALAGCATSDRGRASGPFAWLKPTAVPPGWSVVHSSAGAALAYPPGWTPIKTDPGTASVALFGNDGRIAGYLNVTPRQGTETLADWSRFRPRHNEDEGDRSLRVIAATTSGHFRSGRGACVIDTYRTPKASYREIACLVAGRSSSAVVVAAAPTALWARQAPTLDRAVSSFIA